jgi:sugar fermentation stimulation protein A
VSTDLLELARPETLIPGILLRRYKRFLADVRLEDGQTVCAHCVNTGAMEGLTAPGARVWLSRAQNPERKLPFTWELVELEGHAIGVNTAMPNRVVGELLRRGALPWLGPRDEIRPEKKYGERSRVDFWLRAGDRETYVEVKNCHLVYPDGFAYFPDSVSERAAHHVEELAAVLTDRVAAHVLFFVQVPDAQGLRPSDVHDPSFAMAARKAAAKGVGFSAILIRQDAQRIQVQAAPLPVDLAPYPLEPVRAFRARLSEKTKEAMSAFAG